MSSSPILSSSSEAPDRPVPLITDGSELLSRMGDVRCAVDFIVGTGTLKVEDCLRLGRQTVIPLEQSAGSDLRVDVHGVTIATGEIVVINDTVALRIGRMTPPAGTENT